MKYKELLTHLLNLKILSYCDRYKETFAEYIRSIHEENQLEIEIAILESDDEVSKKRKKKMLNIYEKQGVKLFAIRVERYIDSLLKECGMTHDTIEATSITLDNLLETFSNPKYKPLTDFLFGEVRDNYDIEGVKIRPQLIKYYKALLENGFYNLSFIEYFSLVEGFSIRLLEVFDNTKKQFTKTLKTKSAEERKDYIKELYNRYIIRVKQSPYILVGSNLDYQNHTIENISYVLNLFLKTTPIKIESFNEQEDKIIQFFSDSYFQYYLESEYNNAVKTIALNEDEIYNTIQNRNLLTEVMFKDSVELFQRTERELISSGYFDKKGNWAAQKKDLTEFLVVCFKKKYFRYWIDDSLIVRRFFEKRYNIKFDKQFQPNERAKIDLETTKFSWVITAS